MKRAFFVLVLAAAAGSAFAQQYKWVDENGRVRYGDVPPAGVNATPLRPPAQGAATPAPDAKKDSPKAFAPGQGSGKRQEDAQKERETQAKAEQDAQIKRENCARAQEVLRTMESGQRISRTDSKGERYYLDDAQIAQETAKARESVQQWCK
ncbi:MAG TPA: DUF4124 domain-containing protein [Burkholderiales bacterium]|nr:DUF4124 domain-containing protein [Burkholderiales bacterium]